jgi:uncharacterized protein
VIVPDVNLLLYANNPVTREYTIARNWVEAILRGNEFVGFSWPVLCGFLRISTSPRTFPDPLEMEFALKLVNDWINRDHVIVLNPTDDHWVILNRLITDGKVRGAITSDAEIATYATEHGGTLYTTDRGFARFPGLKFINPIA